MKCEQFGVCGGCTYNIPYNEELRLKEAEVLRLFEEAAISTGEYLGVLAAPSPCEYRNKMEFAFGD
ncbi:MAG: 23S rRNA (uracil-5-)-methyltransferase RumA, partial [Defluviitaleaceae bacterium]|nr:23S rRNA (uracil-5-)-methyltransferase RumA [Defluviitaleaceae bacterium]